MDMVLSKAKAALAVLRADGHLEATSAQP